MSETESMALQSYNSSTEQGVSDHPSFHIQRIWSLHGSALVGLGRYEEAEQAYMEAAKHPSTEDEFPSWKEYYCWVLIATGRFSETRMVYIVVTRQ